MGGQVSRKTFVAVAVMGQVSRKTFVAVAVMKGRRSSK